MFNLTEFLNDKVAIHCRTKEIASNFLSTLEKMGIIITDQKEKLLYEWCYYGDNTCYDFDEDVVGYSSLSFYTDEGYKLHDWEKADADIPKTRTNLFQRIIEHYGKNLQTVVAIEEMSELTKALTKQLRGNGNKGDIAEEMADVYICLEQLKLMYDISDETINTWVDMKTKRVEMRLKESENGGA